jgi:hypothetical protein
VSKSVDGRALDRGRWNAVRTSMLLVGVVAAGVCLLLLPTSLMSLTNTQVETGPPIVKASDKWIRLGVEASSSQVATPFSQYEFVQPIEPKQARPRHKDPWNAGQEPRLARRALSCSVV